MEYRQQPIRAIWEVSQTECCVLWQLGKTWQTDVRSSLSFVLNSHLIACDSVRAFICGCVQLVVQPNNLLVRVCWNCPWVRVSATIPQNECHRQTIFISGLTFLRLTTPSFVSLSVDMENMLAPSEFMMLYLMSALMPRSSSFALIFPTGFPTWADSGTYCW